MSRTDDEDRFPHVTKVRAPRSRKSSALEGPASDGRAIVRRVREILLTKKLTIYKVSALSKAMFPGETSYQIPRNFYFQLRSRTWSPTIRHLVALARISGYRLLDWMVIFRFRLDALPRLQCELPQKRTIVLDDIAREQRELIPWFRDRIGGAQPPAVAPLTQLLELSGEQQFGSLVSAQAGTYFYAKIGSQDALAFPELLPGSIVRANSRLLARISLTPRGEVSKHIFLVEHSRGVCCCRLYFETAKRVSLTATQLPFASVELELGTQVRLLGILDMEFRPMTTQRRTALGPSRQVEVAPDLGKLWIPEPLKQANDAEHPAHLLRHARLRAGLSLHRASEMSRLIANTLRDKRYFASPGWLSDFEAQGILPRQIHKLLTVCVLYSVRFQQLLNSFGISLIDGSTAIPDEWFVDLDGSSLSVDDITHSSPEHEGGFLTTLLERFGDVPLFLRRSFSSLCGLSEVTLRDIFWVGGQREPLHPLLVGAFFVVVDRRKRRPRISPGKSPWEQPVYLLARRDGSYVLSSCSLADSTIVLHPYVEGFLRSQRLRNRVDAHILGQVVTVVRSLPSPP